MVSLRQGRWRSRNRVHPARRTQSSQAVPGRRIRSPRDNLVDAQLLDSVDIIPQRLVPLTGLILLELFVVAGIVAGRLLGYPGWRGAAVGLAIASIFLLRIRGMTLPNRFTLAVSYVWERR